MWAGGFVRNKMRHVKKRNRNGNTGWNKDRNDARRQEPETKRDNEPSEVNGKLEGVAKQLLVDLERLHRPSSPRLLERRFQ